MFALLAMLSRDNFVTQNVKVVEPVKRDELINVGASVKIIHSIRVLYMIFTRYRVTYI